MTSTLRDRPVRQTVLDPYVPRMVVDWLRDHPGDTWREVEGSLAFVDISGFTTLTERLARNGKVGAEEMSDLLNSTFAELLDVAYLDGAGLVKWGGDAVLLLFQGDDHAARACRAAYRMRARMRTVGKLETSAGRVVLRMSVGVHSGTFHFFLVGDPTYHRELLISGPAASRCADLEALADAGEIMISEETARLLPARVVGRPKGHGRLLSGQPRLDDLVIVPRPPSDGLDIGSTLPVAIRAHLQQASGEAEHRQIAVAFVQFSGTDALLAAHGPEVLAQALDEAVRNVQEATAHHGVTFFETDINRDGGKIMLTAGAPRSSDHDEERMLRAARRIMDRVGVLPLRIGINRGAVFAGDFGPPFRKTFSVKGDAINLAARVMGKATPGQVLATTAVIDRSRTVFDIELLPPFMVKGKSAAVSAASIGRVVGERTEREEAAPLIGRETEMAALEQALATARTAHGVLVELVGEPGIGKSRLVSELRMRSGDGVRTVTATCDEYESSTAYFPIRGMLREVLGIARDADDAALAALLAATVRDATPDLLPWLPLLSAVLDIEAEPTPETENLDEAFRKDRLEDVTVTLLEALLTSPTVLVLDDAHLMDDASAELVRRLTVDLAAHPWLLLVTRRDQPSGYVPEVTDDLVSVRPAPLDAVQALGLVESALADSPLPPHQMAALVERSGGNPLFLRGLVLAAQTGASLDALPDSVEALITSQIDRLPPDERTVLRYASVLGVTFSETDLRAILVGQPLPTGRAALTRMGHFLRPAGHGRYRFEHALIRDAAYEGLPFRRRQDLHGRVGEHLENAADDPDEWSELLSLHYFHAGCTEKAWHYSRVAGDRAREKSATVEAVQFYTRALAAGRSLKELGARERADVLELLGDAHTNLGALTDALAVLRQARRLRRDDPRAFARVCQKEALVHQYADRFSLALRTLSHGLSALDAADLDAADMDAVGPQPAAENAAERDGNRRGIAVSRSHLEATYASCRLRQGRAADAISWATRAEADAEAAADKPALARAYDLLFGVYLTLGRTAPKPYGSLALALLEELDSVHLQAQILNQLGYFEIVQGHGTAASDYFERARAAFVRAGDSTSAAMVAYNVGDLLARQGRIEEAEAVFTAALPVFRASAMGEWTESTRRELGRLAVRRGRHDEGRATLDRARAALDKLGLALEVCETDVALVEARIAAGQWETALADADRARPRALTLDLESAVRLLDKWRGVALRELGRVGEARAALERALAACEEEGEIDVGGILVELAAVARLQDDPSADELERRGQESLTRLGVVSAG